MPIQDNSRESLPYQPFDDDGPVFRQPWEAQAFALAIQLCQEGAFTWSEWTNSLGIEIAKAKEQGDPDFGHTYYQYWLNALENLVIKKGLHSLTAIENRAETWRRAYLRTPHGQPVELETGRLRSSI